MVLSFRLPQSWHGGCLAWKCSSSWEAAAWESSGLLRDALTHALAGQYCKFDEPRTRSFTWAREPLKPGWTKTQATRDFQPRGNGTNLVLTHGRFRSEPDKRDHMNGWRGCLRRLSLKFGG